MGSFSSVKRLLLTAAILALPIGVGEADPTDDPAPATATSDPAAVESAPSGPGDEPVGLAPDGLNPQPDAVLAVDPSGTSVGALPFPQPAPGSGSDVPKSSLFYLLPFFGLWLILRRRTRGTRRH